LSIGGAGAGASQCHRRGHFRLRIEPGVPGSRVLHLGNHGKAPNTQPRIQHTAYSTLPCWRALADLMWTRSSLFVKRQTSTQQYHEAHCLGSCCSMQTCAGIQCGSDHVALACAGSWHPQQVHRQLQQPDHRRHSGSAVGRNSGTGRGVCHRRAAPRHLPADSPGLSRPGQACGAPCAA